MIAVYGNAVGGPEVLTYGDVPEPQVGANEVLIRVRGCSVNRLDVFTRQGSHGEYCPSVIRRDFASSSAFGEIEESSADLLRR